MAEEGVFMDVDAVMGMADTFKNIGEVMQKVNQGLDIAIDILKATAFFGMVGNMALAWYLEGIKPHVERLANKFDELNLDVIGAVVSYRDGDNSGSERFR